jgi:RNA polymerase sigma factor (sigma-70 family)
MEDWVARLEQGASDAAWDLFISRYRRLIFAAIRHYAQDYDDVMDVFARVCEALREDDMRRLRSYLDDSAHRARFSTWLFTVVRHLTIDWFRRRDGRRGLPAAAEGLPPLQQRIFQLVFLDGRGHVETYEVIRAREAPGLSFGDFLAELRSTYGAVTAGRRGSALRELSPAPLTERRSEPANLAESEERQEILERALASLGPEDRVAVELYVVEELPAADVARIVGLPNAKAVYNRVYRALATLREQLEKAGIRREDL